MKTLYLDCSMGAAGDMLMGALLDLHPDPDGFLARLNGLGVPHTRVETETVLRCGITSRKVRVRVHGQEEDHHHDHAHEHAHDHDHEHPHDHTHDHDHEHDHDHDHEHDHDHPHAHEQAHSHEHDHTHAHRGLGEIEALFQALPVSDQVRRDALGVYGRIAQAEAQVHGRPVELVHFHEVGALDAVMDILGVCLLMEELGPVQVFASPVRTGFGQVRCAHGVLPVPAPATALLLQGLPVFAGELAGEMCTPTGAALLGYFVKDFIPMPPMRMEKIGYGAGSREFETANVVRAILGDTADQAQDQVVELRCNLDDMTGEDLAFAQEALLNAGARDVFFTPIQMKKGRPGYMVTCICDPQQEGELAALLLRHTTTLGVRATRCSRYILQRESHLVDTPLGRVGLKQARGYGVEKRKYEYEDVARLAREAGLSMAEARRRLEEP